MRSPHPPAGPISFAELRAAAHAHSECTADSLTYAAEAYTKRLGVDVTALQFELVTDYPLAELKRSDYQRLYETVAEVGQYQLDGGKAQSVADEMMEWFTDMVHAADPAAPLGLFPAAAVTYDDGITHLFDGCHRTAARGIAGQDTVPVYRARAATTTPV